MSFLARTLRWGFWLGASLALVYFSATVPLGDKPLFEHLRAAAFTR